MIKTANTILGFIHKEKLNKNNTQKLDVIILRTIDNEIVQRTIDKHIKDDWVFIKAISFTNMYFDNIYKLYMFNYLINKNISIGDDDYQYVIIDAFGYENHIEPLTSGFTKNMINNLWYYLSVRNNYVFNTALKNSKLEEQKYEIIPNHYDNYDFQYEDDSNDDDYYPIDDIDNEEIEGGIYYGEYPNVDFNYNLEPSSYNYQKTYYVGQALNMKRRWNEHLLRKFKDKKDIIEFSIIRRVAEPYFLNYWEYFYIKVYEQKMKTTEEFYSEFNSASVSLKRYMKPLKNIDNPEVQSFFNRYWFKVFIEKTKFEAKQIKQIKTIQLKNLL